MVSDFNLSMSKVESNLVTQPIPDLGSDKSDID